MSKNRVNHIFTYGTLMSTAQGTMGAAERAMMRRHARCLGPAHLRGAMFDAGRWPGVVLDAATRGRVHGEIWQLRLNATELLAALDHYEGCTSNSPLPHSYARRKARVRLPDGRRVTAWIYLWIGATSVLKPVPDGRWRGLALPIEEAVPLDPLSREVAA